MAGVDQYFARRNLLRRGCTAGFDQGALPLGIRLVDKRADRHGLEIGVCQVAAAVGIGQFHRLRQVVNVGGAVVPHGLEVIAFQDVQYLDDVDAAGRGGWCGYNLEILVTTADRLALDRAVRRQIRAADQAIPRLHLRENTVSHLPCIEALVSFFGNLLQRPGQIRLLPAGTNRGNAPFGVEEQFARLGVGGQAFGARGDLLVEREGDLQPVAGQGDGRCHDLREGQGAVALLGQHQARHGAGNTG